MRGRTPHKVWLVAFFVLALASQGDARRGAQHDLRAKLLAPVRSYSVTGEPFVVALAHAAGSFKVAMGVVWVDTPAARKPLTISLRETTVGGVFNEIVRTQPGYAVRADGEVLHILPAGAIPPRENFLTIKIPRYSARNEFVDSASRRLWALVNRVIAPPPPARPGRPGGIAGSGATTLEYPTVNVDLRGASVEGILDALVLDSPRKIWIVTFDGDGALTPTGFRRARTLWTRRAVPDDQQPTWNLFHWGDAVPTALLGGK